VPIPSIKFRTDWSLGPSFLDGITLPNLKSFTLDTVPGDHHTLTHNLSLFPIAHLASRSAWSLSKLKIAPYVRDSSTNILQILLALPALKELHLRNPSRDVVMALVVDPLDPGRALLPQLEILCLRSTRRKESSQPPGDEDVIQMINSRSKGRGIVKSLKVVNLGRDNKKMASLAAKSLQKFREKGMQIDEVPVRHCDDFHVF
jgi:hypothetical protein